MAKILSSSAGVVARGALFLACALAFTALPSCKRACEQTTNCKRTCECLNTETNTRTDCTVAYRCEVDVLTCEDAYDTDSCDKLCNDYFANGLCGVSRCSADAECGRTLECDILDLNGAPTGQKKACTVSFACEQTTQSCAIRSIASDADLCANECNAATGG